MRRGEGATNLDQCREPCQCQNVLIEPYCEQSSLSLSYMGRRSSPLIVLLDLGGPLSRLRSFTLSSQVAVTERGGRIRAAP